MYNFSTFLDDNTMRWPRKEVIVCGDRRITNEVLFARVNALAAGLSNLGIRHGDVVAYLMNNRPECLEIILAANRIGAIFLPLNCRLSNDEWAYIVGNAEAACLITEPPFRAVMDRLAPGLPALRHRILLDERAPGWTGYDDLVAENLGTTVPVEPVGPDDPHRLLYTSGTTSRPKGVPLSHANVIAKTFTHLMEFSVVPDDVTLVCGPLYHTGGLDIPALTTFYAGGSLIIMPKFDAAEALRIIATERPTSGWMATAMLNLILKLPDAGSFDTSSLRYLIFGGEKTPRALIESSAKLFPKTWLSDGYGSTETCSGDTFNDAKHVLSKVGSVGRPVRNIELRLFDDEGREVPRGARGEIAIRGAKVFKGYWKDPEATAKAFRDDWFLTGDIGRLDEDGYLYIEDRKKDVIISGGENISASEIERVLYEHPAVMEAAVVAGPHPRWGETPVAYVVCRKTQSTDAAELRQFCLDRLASFKTPQTYHFIAELPRTSSGKVRKETLRAWQREQALPAAETG